MKYHKFFIMQHLILPKIQTKAKLISFGINTLFFNF